MIIKSLELINWIAYKEAKIDFATQPKKNVTLIRGNNLGGKTTIMRAIRWALYGDTGDVKVYKKPLQLLNKDSFAGGDYKVSVKLALKVGSKNVDITRSLKPKKGVKTPSDNDFEMSFFVLENGKGVGEDEDKYIQSFFDPEISDFFIFDGEKLQEYQELTNNPKESKKLQDNIEKLIRRPFLKSALNDLRAYSTTLRSKINLNMNDDVFETISNKLDRIIDLKDIKEKEINGLEISLREEEENLKLAKSERDAFGTKNENVKRLNKVEGQIPEVESKIDIYKDSIKDMNSTSWQQIIGLLADSSLNNTKKNLKEFETDQENISDSVVEKRLLEKSLKDNKCFLCDEEPLSKEKRKRFKVRLDAIKETYSEKSLTSDSTRFIHQINEFKKNTNVKKLIKFNEDLAVQESHLSNLKIEQEDLKVTVGKDRGSVAAAQKKVDGATDEISRIKHDIKKEKYELDGPNAKGVTDVYTEVGINSTETQLEEQYSKLLAKQPSSSEKEHFDEVKKIVEVFEDSIDDLSKELKDKVEHKANEIFKKLIDKDLQNYALEINDNFGLLIINRCFKRLY